MRMPSCPNWADIDLEATVTNEVASPEASVLMLRQLDDAILAVAATYAQPALLAGACTTALGATRRVTARLPPAAARARGRVFRCTSMHQTSPGAALGATTFASDTFGLSGPTVSSAVAVPVGFGDVYWDTANPQCFVQEVVFSPAFDPAPTGTANRAVACAPGLASYLEVFELENFAGVGLWVSEHDDLESL